MMHSTMDAAEAVDIDRASVAVVLQMLDARGDALSFAAARIIRSQEVTILSLDNEVVEAEWRVIAHAAEIDRMNDHRRAFDARRAQKAAKR